MTEVEGSGQRAVTTFVASMSGSTSPTTATTDTAMHRSPAEP